MADISDAIGLTLEQKLVPTIADRFQEIDPISQMQMRTWQNVVRNVGIGRDYKVIKTWGVGLHGGAKFGSVRGGNVIQMNQVTVYDQLPNYPAADETASGAFIQSSVQLIEQRGNLYLPHQVFRADQLNSSIGSVVAHALKGVGRLIAQQEAALNYSTAPTTGALAAIGDTSATVSNNAFRTDVMDFNIAGTGAVGRVHRFRAGMFVDLYNSAGTVKRNQGFNLVIDNVDFLGTTVSIRRVDGGTFQVSTTLNGGITYAGAGGDNDIIVIKDSVSQVPNVIETWIADGVTRTSFFDIDVRKFGDFKSSVPSALNAVLTESQLNRKIYAFTEAFPSARVPGALTTNGVILGFIDALDGFVSGSNSQDGRFRYDRNGEELDVYAGWGKFRYTYGGRPLTIYTSRYCSPGTMYIGNFAPKALMRYVPPPIPGAKVSREFGTELEFVGTVGGPAGAKGIFHRHYDSAGRMTDFVQAPFVRQWQLCPGDESVNWLKLTGITEVTP